MSGPVTEKCELATNRSGDMRVIGDIRALRLAPGEVVVISVDVPITSEMAERLCSVAKMAFPDNKVFVAPPGMSVDIRARDEALPKC